MFEVAISDTIGIAHPGQVPRVLEAVLERTGPSHVALHFHDTRGTALANVLAALPFGITTFDASAGGLGGCPVRAGAAGNLATDDLIYMLNGLGIETGVSLLPCPRRRRSSASAWTTRCRHATRRPFGRGSAGFNLGSVRLQLVGSVRLQPDRTACS